LLRLGKEKQTKRKVGCEPIFIPALSDRKRRFKKKGFIKHRVLEGEGAKGKAGPRT